VNQIGHLIDRPQPEQEESQILAVQLRCIEVDIEFRGDGRKLFIIKQVVLLQLRIVVGRSTQNRTERPGIADREHGPQNRTPLLAVECDEDEAGLRHVGSSWTARQRSQLYQP
jgi:hypothetical protein